MCPPVAEGFCAEGAATSAEAAALVSGTAGDGTWIDRSVTPLRRELGAMAFDGAKTILFGGCCSDARSRLDDTWAYIGGAWTKLSPETAPPGRDQAAIVFDEARHEVVLFGGQGRDASGNVTFGDTWTWDGTDWTREAPTTSPSPRSSASMAFDTVSDQVVLFGGCSAAACDLGDTWTWDGNTWSKREPSNSPSGRSSAAMATSTDHVLLFGGFRSLTGLADTWLWKDDDWIEVAASSSPPARVLPGVASDRSNGSVVMFGGFSSGPEFTMRNDTWIWDGASWSPGAPATSPEARIPTMAYDGASDEVVLYGGLNAGGWWDTDTWTWNGTTWTRRVFADPSERMDATAAYDTARGELVMFSGFCNPNNPNTSPQVASQSPRCGSATFGDTWTYDGSSWTQEETTIAPMNRQRAAIEFHDGTDLVILVGGRCGSVGCADSWTWDGESWTPLLSPPQVTNRDGASMVYDAARDQLVLFGGSGSDATTWTWDGSTWTQHTQTGGPEPRSHAGMAYDAARGEVVLLGGFDHSPSDFQRPAYGDMWTWDGTTWTRETPDAMPPKRYSGTMEYDAATARVILHGGLDRLFDPNSNTVFSDTWAWDGQTWRELAPTRTTYPSMSATSAPFPPFGGILVIGGLPQNPSKILNAVALWRGAGRTKEATVMTLVREGNGSKATLRALLVEADTSEGIASRTITFYVGADEIGSAITGGDGGATISIPPRYRGNVVFEARFDGDDIYLPSSARTP
ncbi:MAG: Kelch repeat-containing protein [Actinomycetota bacterium]